MPGKKCNVKLTVKGKEEDLDRFIDDMGYFGDFKKLIPEPEDIDWIEWRKIKEDDWHLYGNIHDVELKRSPGVLEYDFICPIRVFNYDFFMMLVDAYEELELSLLYAHPHVWWIGSYDKDEEVHIDTNPVNLYDEKYHKWYCMLGGMWFGL